MNNQKFPARITFGLSPCFHPVWSYARDYSQIAVGAFLQALALRLFLVPSKLASGGISGISQVINSYTGWPIGVMIFLGNLPLLFLGWRFLGGRRFALRTAFAVVLISFFTDYLRIFLPPNGLTQDFVLNALYGGVISGIGYGLVYLGQGTSGGSDILARILNHWRGISLSQSYLLTDAVVILLAGLAFSWENALYALVVLYVSGVAAQTITEGASVERTAMIITSQSHEISERILRELERGVTVIPARGAYTEAEREILYCVISRSEVARIKSLVHEVDSQAFMVIGHANEVLGEGFCPLRKPG